MDMDVWTGCLWNSPLLSQKLIVLLLGGLAVYLVALSFRHLRVLVLLRGRSMRLVLNLRPLLEQRDFTSAQALCEEDRHECPMGHVLGAALRAYDELGPCADLPGELRRAVDRAKMRQMAQQRQELASIKGLAGVAPLIGILGTVIGACHVLCGGQAGLPALGGGLGQALAMTAAGLGVAVQAMLAYGYFRGMLEAMALDLDDVSGELIGCLLRPGCKLYSYRSAPLRRQRNEGIALAEYV